MIPEEAKVVMQGAMASVVATCSADGTPNGAVISQIHYVDDRHIALSHQFFNKTARNILENPRAEITGIDPNTMTMWIFDAVFVEARTEGPVFDEMDAQLEAIASMTGMTGIFKLKAAHVYEVLGIRKLNAFGPDPE